MRRILLLAIAIFLAFSADAEEYVTEIEVLKGEKWWGLDCLDRLEQPLTGPIDPPEKEWTGHSFAYPYKSIMLSNAGRYVFSDKPIKVDFDNEKFTITSEHEKIEVQKGGKTLREAYIVCALKNLKPGQSPDPEMFALPIYETYASFGYTHCEEDVVGYAEKLLAEGFPAGIMVISDGWQKVNGPYEFDPELYPDPKRLVDRLHALGFKVMLTITPNVPTWGRVYGNAERNGQLITPHNSKFPVLDMSNDFQFNRLRTGFEKIKADYGFDGYRFEWEYYLQQWNIEAPKGDKKFVDNMMSLGEGLKMVQFLDILDRPYAPYVSASYELFYIDNLQTIIRSTSIAGLMGYPYTHIQYNKLFEERQMADYLLLQCGMPVMSVDFAPWRITDQKLYGNVKAAVNFRASLGDYMRKLVADSRRTGEPLVRHMEYQFPKSGFFDCNDQFMLGTKYLFAPCVDGEDKRLVRFPKGTWTGLNGEKIKGPVVKQIDCSAGQLIVYEAAR